MELKDRYPVLADYISASEVITPQGSELLLYNTITGAKKYPNRAVFNFLTLATGGNTFERIVEELSRQSGEPPEEIWPGLTELADRMVEREQLIISDSPSNFVRTPPPSVKLVCRLENISLETTRHCNLRCRHCYSNAGTPLKDELTREEIKSLIDQLSEIGVLSMTFTGGEPLLHPHIFELMEYARKKPLTVFLFTNGTLITPEVVQKLKELSVFWVSISIDGPDPETHDAFRGQEGAFLKTIRAVNLLREAGISVHAHVSVNKFNYQKMWQILCLFRDLRINEFKILPITYSGRPGEGGGEGTGQKSGEPQIFVTPQEFREAMETIREFEIKELGKKKEEFTYSKKLENCGIGSGSLAIKCNGTVVPCPEFDEDVSLGNIREQSVAEIWNDSPLLNRLRAMSVYKTEICKDCSFAAVCKGGCIADIYERTGTFTCYDEYVCVAFDVTRDDFIPVEIDEPAPSSSLSAELT